MGFLAGPEGLLSVEKITKKAAHEFFQNINRFKVSKANFKGFLGFFEPSTRTSASFESAGLDLGIGWIKPDLSESSLKKGETLKDTFRVLRHYEIGLFVIRHSMSGFAHKVQQWTQRPVLNAGDGMNEHPTQALGDALTLWTQFKAKPLKIVFFGDVFRSRVARSNLLLLAELGHKISVCADGSEEAEAFAKAFKVSTISRKALKSCDVIMALRIQTERGSQACSEPLQRSDLGPKTFVMHPGPVIINQDIDQDVLEKCSERLLIESQVRSGYLVRRKLLSEVLEARS